MDRRIGEKLTLVDLQDRALLYVEILNQIQLVYWYTVRHNVRFAFLIR